MQVLDSDFDQVIFKNTKFADILEDIYITKKDKEKQINELIDHLNTLVSNLTEATLIVPLIRDYLDLSLKNDDMVAKLAAVVQRAISREKVVSSVNGQNESLFTEEDIQDLERIKQEAEENRKKQKDLDEKKEELKSTISNELDSFEIPTTEDFNLINEIKKEIEGEMSDQSDFAD